MELNLPSAFHQRTPMNPAKVPPPPEENMALPLRDAPKKGSAIDDEILVPGGGADSGTRKSSDNDRERLMQGFTSQLAMEPVLTDERIEFLEAMRLVCDDGDEHEVFSTSRFSPKQQIVVYLLLLIKQMEKDRRNCVFPVRRYLAAFTQRLVFTVMADFGSTDARNPLLSGIMHAVWKISDNFSVTRTITSLAEKVVEVG